MKIGKYKFKLMVIIFIISLILPIIMIVKEEIKVSLSIKNTKDILSDIDADEMKEEIIDKLKDTDLNVNTSSIKTEFEEIQKIDKDILKMCTYSSGDDEKGFVYAFIIDEDEEKGIAIPLFRIKSDSDGMFKNIEYISGHNWLDSDSYISSAINNVLKTEYGLEDAMGYHGMRYSREYYGPAHKPSIIGDEKSIKYRDEDIASEIIKEFNHGGSSSYYNHILYTKERTVIWGFLD